MVRADAHGEDLDIQGAVDVACGGELHEQRPVVRCVGQPVRRAVQDKPTATGHVGHGNVFTCIRCVRVEGPNPRLRGAFDHTDGGCRRRRRRFDADGDPAVVGQIREGGEEEGLDAIRRGARCERAVVESSRRIDVERALVVAEDRTQEVRFVHHVDVEAVGGHARQVARGVDRMFLNGHRVRRGHGTDVGALARAEVARPVVLRGCRFVVAGVGLRAAVHFEGVAHAVTVRVHEAVAEAVVAGLGVGARAVVVGGFAIEVARAVIGAAADFEGVAHAVTVRVCEAVAEAVVAGLGVGA